MKVYGQIIQRKTFWWSFVFLFLIVLDQVVKYLAVDIFRNYNFAFSLPLPLWLMYSVYIAVIGSVIYYLVTHRQEFSFVVALGWTMILAGAVCNVTERIILGYVRDFIYISMLGWTGIYNLADGYIILGILILILNSNIENRNPKICNL